MNPENNDAVVVIPTEEVFVDTHPTEQAQDGGTEVVEETPVETITE